jgi:hypothetical protein
MIGIELVGITKLMASYTEKVASVVFRYQNSKREERKRVATLLEHISEEVLLIAKDIDNNRSAHGRRGKIAVFEAAAPKMTKSYDQELAKQIGIELVDVYRATEAAGRLLDQDKSAETTAQLKALVETVEAAAGTISAAAAVLRAS